MAFHKLKQKRGVSAAPETGDRLKDLHAAIVHDDDGLMLRLLTADASLAAHAFGRFPLLSLCYMYRSRKIVRKFAPRLRAHGDNYSVSPEYPDDYRKFRELAGRSLRLFREGFVTYADMLAVIGDAPALRAELGAKPSEEQAERIAKIYELTSKRKVRVKANGVSIPRSRKMNAVQITAIVLIAFFGLGVAGGALGAYYAVPAAFGGDGAADAPILVSNAEQFLFAAGDTQKRYFRLTEDIVIDASAYDGLNVLSDIDCDGHTVKVLSDGSPLFEDISGKLRNGIFDFGEINIEYSTDSALLTRTVTGAAERITLKANGSLTDTSGNETVYFGCLAVENSGTVNYVTAELGLEVTGASAGGESAGDSFFAGIVAKNSGSVAYCSVTENSVITLDTADGAGIIAENAANGRVLDSTNAAAISQTSSYAMWSPNASGVVLNNYGTVNNCVNSGDVSVSSEASEEEVKAEMEKLGRSGNISVYAGGVICNNYGTVRHSKNNADVTAHSVYAYIYAAGVAAANAAHSEGSALIDNCAALGTLSVSTAVSSDSGGDEEEVSTFLFSGGVTAYMASQGAYSASVTNSYSVMRFTRPDYPACYAGAIVGTQYTSSPTVLYGLTSNYYLTGSVSGFNAGIGSLLVPLGNTTYIYYSSGVDFEGGAMPMTQTQLEQWSYYW